MGPETKKDCAGEGQYFTRAHISPLVFVPCLTGGADGASSYADHFINKLNNLKSRWRHQVSTLYRSIFSFIGPLLGVCVYFCVFMVSALEGGPYPKEQLPAHSFMWVSRGQFIISKRMMDGGDKSASRAPPPPLWRLLSNEKGASKSRFESDITLC